MGSTEEKKRGSYHHGIFWQFYSIKQGKTSKDMLSEHCKPRAENKETRKEKGVDKSE